MLPVVDSAQKEIVWLTGYILRDHALKERNKTRRGEGGEEDVRERRVEKQ